MLNGLLSSENTRLVPSSILHKYNGKLLMQGGETVGRKNVLSESITVKPIEYDMQIKHGKTKICIVAPPPMTQEETERVLDDYYSVAWSIIESISENKTG